ncbi:hypothetical protein SAMN05421780_10636 [Flexibacter flexilis DSM 6793]|uniref:Uncharacterized protein n=1 Tax=Flexibacter flexilis DSM 6793 TaxID=927664 RepID=A0A1I1JTG0_9BACT|nr:hypothetical protein [Flexibacter flexilis]SFC49123.1 hypothetical protein SAMN05421780_10636 [Flexibacter flexilis DSM 6793]
MNLSENKAIDRVKKAADKFHFTTDQPPHFYLRMPFEGLVGQKVLFIDS